MTWLDVSQKNWEGDCARRYLGNYEEEMYINEIRWRDTRLQQMLEDQDHSEDSLSPSLLDEEEEDHATYLMKTQR